MHLRKINFEGCFRVTRRKSVNIETFVANCVVCPLNMVGQPVGEVFLRANEVACEVAKKAACEVAKKVESKVACEEAKKVASEVELMVAEVEAAEVEVMVEDCIQRSCPHHVSPVSRS